MTIPFYDVRRCYVKHREEFDEAYARVMERGHFIVGQELEAFEHEFATFCGAKHTVGVANGLDALIMILRALGIGPGDEVIVSAHTFVASWSAISMCGAKPVPVPPVAGGLLMDVNCVEKLITPATKAIMPVHLYGLPVDISSLRPLCAAHKLAIIEDAAQAHGARHKMQACGNLGVAAGFSFYPGKNLGAFGDGGAVTTSDDALCDHVKLLRNYGSRQKYVHEILGYNSRLDEIQAAFLRIKLRYLEAWNERRRQIAGVYSKAMERLSFLSAPQVGPDDLPVWHQYVIRTHFRDELQKHLQSLHIETLIHYPIANHKQALYAGRDFSRYHLEGYEQLVKSVLSLPIDPFMPDSEVEAVIQGISSFVPPA